MSQTNTRELHLGVNLHGAGGHAAAWRWPGTNPNAFVDIGHYISAAQTAERGLFDTVFLADRPTIAVNLKKQPPVTGLEPTVILSAVARATRRIGLIGTASSTYNEPYNLARRFLSLDHISNGRAAWNVVTSSDPSTVGGFGGKIWGRDERYKRAEEFVEVVRALWQSWGEGTILADKASGRYADIGQLRPYLEVGEHFSVRGPLTLPGSKQGHPVIVQAGGSPAGQKLAGRSADVVFAAASDLETAIQDAENVRDAARKFGRTSLPVILPGLVTVLGSTEAAAQTRLRQIDDLLDREAALRALAERIQVPAEKLKLDEPIPVELLPKLQDVNASIGHHRTIDAFAREGRTVRQILSSVQGGGHRVVVGAPEQIADSIEQWFRAGAVDGFNIMPDVLSDGLSDFVDHVVPLLQRKGIFRTEYRGETLRQHLGLPLPSRGQNIAAA